jgi:methylmalonyl-CoA/ethylmalonyl-CoA epimerase
MITGLAHVAVAVTNLEAAITLWIRLTGGKVVHREMVTDRKVEIAIIEIGNLRVELLAPTSADSPIAKFLVARGPGLHHVALQSTSAPAELERLKESGMHVIDETPRTGAENTRVAFLHPKALGGVLVEIVEQGKG